MCLCFQQKAESTPTGLTLHASVFIFQSKLRIDLKVPLEDLQGNLNYVPKIFFDSIGDILIVMVPGYYLQFIYCGQDINTGMGIKLQGSTFVEFSHV